MPGRRAPENADFVTPMTQYREEITAVDAVGPESPAVPELDTTLTGRANVGLGDSDASWYGRDGRINFAAIIQGFTSVTFELWFLAELEMPYTVGDEPPASPQLLPSTEEWVFVTSTTLTRSGLWRVQDIPPGTYKVLVTAVAGAGNVRLREQHAA